MNQLLDVYSNQILPLLHEYGFKLNSREWAALAWITVLIATGLLVSAVRTSAARILQTAFAPKLFGLWLVYLAWVVGFIWITDAVGLWKNAFVKDTAVWVLTAGLVIFCKFPDASRSGFFLTTLKTIVSVTVLLEYFIALSSFSFWSEFLLQPVIAICAMILVYAERQERFASSKYIASGILIVYTLFLITHSMREVYVSEEQTDIHLHALRIAWPIFLAFSIIPLVYIMAALSGYGMVFRRMNWSHRENRASWKSKLGMMLALGVRIDRIHEAAKGGTVNVANKDSVRDAYKAARELIKQKVLEQNRENEYQRNLIRYAGSSATNEDGRPLDRREFRETARALRWLYTCHSGWYSKAPEGYKKDLLERLGDDFSSQGLPAPSGICMRVSEDGQRWYAWRKTPSGRYFAIGASCKPPDQWLYDGPNPPSGFPKLSKEWGDAPFVDANAPNWLD